MTTHIDTMQEWWKLAEVGIPQAGDTVIFDERHRGLGFHVAQATKDHPRGYDSARILSRAPKPEPAWHDAVAVIAHTDEKPAFRDVWVADNGEWRNPDGDFIDPADLRDVTPLIEQKVTDEMVERGAQASNPAGVRYLRPHEVREVLTAALGLETA